MTNVLLVIFFVGVTGLLASLIFLIPKATRADARWGVALSAVVTVGAIYLHDLALDREAWLLGFLDHRDRTAARKAGFEDAKPWVAAGRPTVKEAINKSNRTSEPSSASVAIASAQSVSAVPSAEYSALRPGSVAPQGMTKDQQAALEHTGQVLAATFYCPNYQVNSEFLGVTLAMFGLKLGQDPEAAECLAQRRNHYINSVRDQDPKNICPALWVLYGPHGLNVKNLLRER